MARVFLKIVKEPILISNDRAKTLADLLEKYKNGEIEDQWIRLDAFNGELSVVKTVLLDEETKSDVKKQVEIKLTPEEEASANAARTRVRENLIKSGIIKPTYKNYKD